MSINPILSICVPSRNRQVYFQQTIDGLRLSPRTDVQFVFADNSDDPSVMNEYMRDLVGDPRIVYLPSPEKTLSMVDNWERTMEVATGEYVVFIGDDDFVDPELAEFIRRVLEYNPGVEAFGWRAIGYTWPYPGRGSFSVPVPYDSSIVKIEQAELFKRMFGWHDSRHVPTSGFSIYHHAISRRLLERIKLLYGGKYFEHPVVDYDNAFKVICLGSKFVATSRPFGIMGSCPASNSFSVGKLEDLRRKMATFAEEAGQDFENDPLFREFPFVPAQGTTATIGVAQHWFKSKYNISFENWGENFAKACAMDCQFYFDRDAFDAATAGYRKSFELWENGRYLKHFNPVFDEARSQGKNIVPAGFTDTGVIIDQELPVKNSAEMYAVVNAMCPPIDMLDIGPGGLKHAWETEDKIAKMLRA
ncbi:glycosyltransferase family 2 protein [Gellertiella hungarica]|uniref:Glycosyltransferase 2-like domain-containing protein n=1 Tax=Gellertiella hungarica TaxID=1572859 RepID=A0A7W6NK55_9HYPH|nr:glycosyltransferase [Gellertiella hungarica]MBB4063937.1 hypothetical protein [Gellertiella hungarica]